MTDETVLSVNEDGSTMEIVGPIKVKTVRASGRPVKLEDLGTFEKEWKDGFDAIYDSSGRDMELVSEKTEAFHAEMASKYDTIVEWDLLATPDDWQNVILEYGSILVSTHKDTGELMYVIMDQGI